MTDAPMRGETARLLGTALRMRTEAEKGLMRLAAISQSYIEIPEAINTSMVALARAYVHEQRVINRIISEDEDP